MNIAKETGVSLRTADVAALGAIVLMAGALRLSLSGYSLWFDEFAAIFFADKPIGLLWSSWIVRETNPPLYYTILHGWIAVFGLSQLTLRLLSILGGIVGIGLLIWLAARCYGPRAAFAVALLAALSPQHIYFSQQVRAYIFGFDAVLLSLIGLYLFGAEQRRYLGLALYVGGAILAVYLHTTFLLWPLIGSLAFVVVFWRQCLTDRGRPMILFLAANLLIGVGAAWWILMTVRQLTVSHANIDWIEPMSLRIYRYTLVQTIFLGRSEYGWARLLPYAFVAATIAGAVATWRNRTTRLIVAALVLAILVFGAFGLVRPIVLARTLFWFSIFPLLLIAAGIGAIRSDTLRYAALATSALLLLLSLQQGWPRFHTENWSRGLREAAAVPGGTFVVEGEATAVAADYACRVEFPNKPCPVSIAVLTSGSPRFDLWAKGMSSHTTVSPTQFVATLAPNAHIFIQARRLYDPVESLRDAGFRLPPRTDGYRLSGPYSRSDFQTRYQRPPIRDAVATSAAR